MIGDRASQFLINSSFHLRVCCCVVAFPSFGVFFLVKFVAGGGGFHDWNTDAESFGDSFFSNEYEDA